MHRLAIVIPYFKIDHFAETLKSLAAQTDQRFALYIGNDFSPDDPLPLMEQYFQPHRYTYLNYSDNLGGCNLALQWARILEHVNEEWFQILGDDDFVSANFVAAFYNAVEALEGPVNVIKVKSLLCDADGATIKQLYGRFETGFYGVLDLLIRKFQGGLNSSLSEHIFRLSKYREVGFAEYALAWHTDDMLLVQMTDFGSLYFMADALVSVRVYEGSTSGSSDNELMKTMASKLFFVDFLELMNKHDLSMCRKLAFLKSLHRYSDSLGLRYLQALYNKSGLVGRALFRKLQVRLLLKACLQPVLLIMLTTASI